MKNKKWYHSKILWVNIIAIIGIVLNSIYGLELDAEVQVALVTTILALINIGLRIITNKGITK